MAIHQPTTDVDFADQEILAASQAGDKIALEILYRWYAPRLLKFCQNRLRNSAEAEDAAHETILKAYAALPTFRDGTKIWPWLATIASNVCTDIQRRQKYFDSAEFTEPVSQDFQEAVDARARAEIVNVALTELPSRYQTLVYLRDFSGLSYEQIAQRLDTSVATVRSRLLRGRSMLRLLIRRVAKQRGHWPLPVIVPTSSSVGFPSTIWRRAQAIRSELAAWWLRFSNFLDALSLAGLVNAAAVVAFIVAAPVTTSGNVSLTNSGSNNATLEEFEQSSQRPQLGADLAAKKASTRAKTYEADPPNTAADLDTDGQPDSWVEIGPIRISCASDSDSGTASRAVKDAACPILGSSAR